MRYPNLREEKRLWRKGFKRVACLDEAGRGALSGPVVAAAVVIKNFKFQILNPKQILNSNFPNSKHVSNLRLRDSKKLSPLAREKLYKKLTRHPGIEWGIGRVSEKAIDKINILEATKLAMKRAIKNLEKKLKQNSSKIHDREKLRKIDFLILDGNFKLNLPLPQKSYFSTSDCCKPLSFYP